MHGILLRIFPVETTPRLSMEKRSPPKQRSAPEYHPPLHVENEGNNEEDEWVELGDIPCSSLLDSTDLEGAIVADTQQQRAQQQEASAPIVLASSTRQALVDHGESDEKEGPTAKQDSSTSSACTVGSGKQRILPLGFKPSPYSVIIGRGKESKDHAVGDRRLRVLVLQFISEYANAINRASKSKLVSSVVSMVREACSGEVGGGAFVKLGKDGRWYEVDEAVAREKVGYTFREMLGDRYRSSSHSKVARKHELRGKRKQPPAASSELNHQPQQNYQNLLDHNSSSPLLAQFDHPSGLSADQTVATAQIPLPGFLQEGIPRSFFSITGVSGGDINVSRTENNTVQSTKKECLGARTSSSSPSQDGDSKGKSGQGGEGCISFHGTKTFNNKK